MEVNEIITCGCSCLTASISSIPAHICTVRTFRVVALQSESVLTVNDLQIKAAVKQFQEAVVHDETLKHAAAALSSTSSA